MLNVNMGLKAGERLLVASDLPREQDWRTASPAMLQDMLERAMLGRLVTEVARARFPQCTVEFLAFPATGGHGTDPDPATAARLREADVVLALTSYSMSHTDARTGATEAGVRLASMPSFEAYMLEPGGPMAADYRQISRDCQIFTELLGAAEAVQVRTPYGTDLRFSLKGRPGNPDDGLYDGTGVDIWGNLPAGETYAVPLEGTGQGRLVAPAGWYPGLEENMVFTFVDGVVVDLVGGGPVGDHFRGLLALASGDPAYVARRNLAELGVGTNPNARRPDNVLEAEKIKGTVHIAIGDSIHMGGTVAADLHEDFVQPEADLILDGRPVIVAGEWQVG